MTRIKNHVKSLITNVRRINVFLVPCSCQMHLFLLHFTYQTQNYQYLSLSRQQTRLLLSSNWVNINHFDAVASFLEVYAQVNSVVTNVWQIFFATCPCHLNLLSVQFTGRDQTVSLFPISTANILMFLHDPRSCESLTFTVPWLNKGCLSVCMSVTLLIWVNHSDALLF